jgi:hypothetical protein
MYHVHVNTAGLHERERRQRRQTAAAAARTPHAKDGCSAPAAACCSRTPHVNSDGASPKSAARGGVSPTPNHTDPCP